MRERDQDGEPSPETAHNRHLFPRDHNRPTDYQMADRVRGDGTSVDETGKDPN